MANFKLKVFIFIQSFVFSNALNKGPYTSTAVSVNYKCNQTASGRPWVGKNGGVDLYLEINGKTFSGNLTVSKVYSGLKVGITSYYLEDDQWKIGFKIPGFSCLRSIVKFAKELMGIKGNNSVCSMYKGTYKFSGIGYDQLMHVLQPEAEYGSTLLKITTFNSKVTIFCFEVKLIIKPN